MIYVRQDHVERFPTCDRVGHYVFVFSNPIRYGSFSDMIGCGMSEGIDLPDVQSCSF
jgi:hypothetical protein